MKDGFRDKGKLAWALIFVGLLLLPLILGEGYYINTMNFIALYSIVALGLCMLTGYGGQLSISHSAFFAIGAYASAITSLRFELHPFLTIFSKIILDFELTIF